MAAETKGEGAVPGHTADTPFGDVTVDMLRQQVTIGERQLTLGPRDFALLYLLLQRAGETVEHDFLHQALGACGKRALDSSVYRLRKNLEGSGYEIQRHRGVGYRLERLEE